MNLPPRSALPKPPPKAPPPSFAKASEGKPAVKPAPAAPVQPAMLTPAAQPGAPAPARSAAPSLPPQVRQMSTPMIDPAGLPPAMGAMLEAIRLYEDILVEENDKLRVCDAKGVEVLLERKMAATKLYQERLRSVLGDGEVTRQLTPEQRGQIVAQVKSLEALAHENTVLLKANMSAIEQLFEVINTAARKMRKREVSYSQGGVIRDYHNAYAVSLAYNHTV